MLENLLITTDSKDPGILVEGAKNVVIRNVRIEHSME